MTGKDYLETGAGSLLRLEGCLPSSLAWGNQSEAEDRPHMP